MAVIMNMYTNEPNQSEALNQVVEEISEDQVLPGMTDVETTLSQIFNVPSEIMDKLLAH